MQCSKDGVCRCIVCKTWYCSKECQADHWPTHWRDCLPLPDLEWPLLKSSSTAYDVKENVSSKVESVARNTTKVGSAKIVEINNDSNTPSPIKPSPPKTVPTSEPEKRAAEKTKAKADDSKTSDPVMKQSEASKDPTKQEEPVKDPVKPATPTPSNPSPVTSSNEVEKKSSVSKMYEDAIISEKITAQILTKKINEILPVDEANNPSDFVIRLAEQVSLFFL